mmetsp:Transcript_1220/g.3365  ORF Transcript_1220/g.3365 Transcript_1220/m.3365 type:complete len:239 (-) Transcript_1220:14-730(-)
MSRPPKFRSNAWLSTFSCPFLNATTHTCRLACPMSTNMTCCGLSSGRSVRKMPYASAVAVVSFMSRRQLNPAMRVASSMARLCFSLKKAGTPTTTSVTFEPWSASAMSLRSAICIARHRCGENCAGWPRYVTLMRGSLSGPGVTLNGRFFTSSAKSGSLNDRPIILLSWLTVFFGFIITFAEASVPMNLCFSSKLTMDGVSRLDSLLSMTSTPRRRASATVEVRFPMSTPHTDILVEK